MESTEFFDALADVPNMRSASFDDVEMKDGGNVYLFDGYAAVYNTPSDLGDFTEEIRAGAFDNVVAEGMNVPFLHEHHPHQLLATTKSGRLKLESDAKGLRTRAKVVKTDLSARVKALVDSGDITGMSYGFVAGKGNQQVASKGGRPHRLLTGFRKLLDVSTTWDPAFPTTEAQFRSQALQYVSDPDSWQRLLLGAYPQLAELGHDSGSGGGEQERVDGADEQRSIAARKRALDFIVLTTGGIEP